MPKRKKLSSLNAKVQQEFDRICNESYEKDRKNKRWINLGSENPFLEGNKPPIDHLIPDKILEKPNKIQNLNLYKNDKPLAGRFSEIGEKLLQVGNRKAFMIHTGPWGEIQIKDSEA